MPDLDWDGALPVSRQFQDSYYSSEDGLAESRAVFLAGCGLRDGWAGRDRFIIGETGFGTGLNFLAAWQAWRETRKHRQRLHFISLEAYPISAEEARRAHARWPELKALSEALSARWPPPDPGAHFRRFDEDGVFLTVFHGEARAALAEMDFEADAWFLDGFAPAQNPEMWSLEVMTRIAALSAPGARAATFTVAGAVRRSLSEAGFAVAKQPGHGRKRERLEARLPGAASMAAHDPGSVAVIGGGVAGASLTGALAARGFDAAWFGAGQAASTPPRALLTPRLENADRPHARALMSAFHYASSRYPKARRGVLRLAKNERDGGRFEALAERWAGLEARDEGLWMQDAAVLDPAAALTALSPVTKLLSQPVAAIQWRDGAWRLTDACGGSIAEVETIVLAAGAGTRSFKQADTLELELSAGQLGLHEIDGALETPVAGPAYAAPAGEDRVMIGATHDAWDNETPPAPDAARQAALADALFAARPELTARIRRAPLEMWSGVRAATKNRLPVAGQLEEGLYVLTGLGSRGFAHAPLLAEQVAARICGDPPVLETSGAAALDPLRFAERRARKG